MKKIFLLIVVVCIFLNSKGTNKFYIQPPKQAKYGIETTYYFGKIIKHNSRVTTPIHQFSNAYEIGVNFYNFGEKPWQRQRKYPNVGVSFMHAIYGDRQYFGHSFSLLPYINLWLFRTKHVDGFFRMGFGIGFLTKHNNPVDNPLNVMTGSVINNITQFKMGFNWKINEHIYITTNGSLTHWSNAKFQNPNLGINLVAGSIGLHIFPWVKDYSYNLNKPGKPRKRNEGLVKFSMGFNEMGKVAGGPKFPKYIGTIGYNRYTGSVNKIMMGVNIAYDPMLYQQFKYSEIHKGTNQRWKATNMSVYIGDELMFGKLGLFALVGYYVYYVEPKPKSYYFKFGANYYYYAFGKNKEQKMFVSVNLKTHNAIAEMLEFGTGITF